MKTYKDFENALANSALNLAPQLTHEQFIEGINSKELQYQVIGEPSVLLEGRFKKAFNFWLMFYWISPLIVVPLGAYFAGNWLLLIGIVFSIIGSLTAVWNLATYLILYFIGQWIGGYWHFKDYDDFFALCMIWGWFWWKVADQSQSDYADLDLKKKPEVFYSAVEKKRIIITKKE